MDETALLAMGILVEEYIKEMLGPTGHLMYAEKDNDQGESSRSTARDEGEENESSDSD